MMIVLAVVLHQMRGHEVACSRVTVPLFDPWAQGKLYKCSCGKVWAK